MNLNVLSVVPIPRMRRQSLRETNGFFSSVRTIRRGNTKCTNQRDAVSEGRSKPPDGNGSSRVDRSREWIQRVAHDDRVLKARGAIRNPVSGVGTEITLAARARRRTDSSALVRRLAVCARARATAARVLRETRKLAAGSIAASGSDVVVWSRRASSASTRRGRIAAVRNIRPRTFFGPTRADVVISGRVRENVNV